MTRGKEIVRETVAVEKLILPNPFMNLDVIRSKGSSGKCWVFHINKEGLFKGYLFPSGFRIVGFKKETVNRGDFFWKTETSPEASMDY